MTSDHECCQNHDGPHVHGCIRPREAGRTHEEACRKTHSSRYAETRAQWRADAEAHADETRHPSGYYPSARIITLLDALEVADRRHAGECS